MNTDFFESNVANANSEHILINLGTLKLWLVKILDGDDFGTRELVQMNIYCETSYSSTYTAMFVSLSQFKIWMDDMSQMYEKLAGSASMSHVLEHSIHLRFAVKPSGSIDGVVKFLLEKEEHTYQLNFDQSFLQPALLQANRFLATS